MVLGAAWVYIVSRERAPRPVAAITASLGDLQLFSWRIIIVFKDERVPPGSRAAPFDGGRGARNALARLLTVFRLGGVNYEADKARRA